MDMPGRFNRLIVMNTTSHGRDVTEGFLSWRAFCNRSPA